MTRVCSPAENQRRCVPLQASGAGLGSSAPEEDVTQESRWYAVLTGTYPANRSELVAGTRGKLPPPQEQALLTAVEELETGTLRLALSGTALAPVSQKEETLSQEAPLPKTGFVPKTRVNL